uniref:Uncharacterized protein n=1 Tax=Papio anubis TaxID=9555 RepID=A0A8I5N565_PAPAN
CLPKACTGLASASQRTLHAKLSPDCGLPRPELLLPLGSCAGPRSCLPVASLGPAHSSRGTAFPGPAFAFWRPLQAPNFLRPASPGPVAASRPHVRAQLLLLLAAAAGPAPASRQPLWTRLRPSSRSAAFVGPKRPEAGLHGGLSGPGSCPPTASPSLRLPSSLSRPSSSSRRPLQAHAGLHWSSPGLAPAPGGPTRRPVGLRRPSSCLSAASPAARLPQVSLSRPSSSSRRLLQAHAGLESASPGLTPAPGVPCGPNSSPSRPPPAQLLPLRGLSSCQTSSGQPLQALLLLPATGLLRPSPAHASGRPPQAQELSSSRPRQAQPPASRRPAEAQPLPP